MTNGSEELAPSYCRDYIRGHCGRDNCRFTHDLPPKSHLKELFRFCHDYQNKGCFRINCKFIHSSVEDEQEFLATGVFPGDSRNAPPPAFHQNVCASQEVKFNAPDNNIYNKNNLHNAPPNVNQNFVRTTLNREEDCPPEAKFRRYNYEENGLENHLPTLNSCPNCDNLDRKVKLLHDNISVLLKKVADLTEKNLHLSSMNEFLLEQTASVRTEQSCVITSRHGTSAPVSLATVSVTPVVGLAGALPTLVPAAATPNLTLAPAASRAQILTPAPQILTVSTTQQLVGNSGTLIVTGAGAQQLMQVSDSGTLMGAGQTVVVTPAQLTLAPPPQQLMSNANPAAVQQLVQQTASQLVQPQLAQQHQANQYAQQSVQQHLAQQNAQHVAAQQNAQHFAAQQNAQHLAAQQNAQHLAQQNVQHLAAQQSAQHAQHLAAQQNAQHLAAQHNAQQLAAQQNAVQRLQSAQQQLVHQASTQQITLSSTGQPLSLTNSQAQPITFPIISQNILPH